MQHYQHAKWSVCCSFSLSQFLGFVCTLQVKCYAAYKIPKYKIRPTTIYKLLPFTITTIYQLLPLTTYCVAFTTDMSCVAIQSSNRIKSSGFWHWISFFKFNFLKTVHSQQSQTVAIHIEQDSKATEHRQLPMSQEQQNSRHMRANQIE